MQQEVVYRSQEAEELGVPECGYGLDVIVEIGYQRFWHQRRVAEIHKGLKERITISERQVLNLIGTFLALLRAGQPAKVVNQQKKWKRLGGLILSIDGMQPEKGSPALYVVREVQLDITLMAEVLESGTHKTLVSALLEPINEWEIPIKGIISDAQENIQLAVAQVWPNCPHQTCQFHCIKEAGRLTYALDRTMKTQLKKKLRGFLNRVYKTVRELAETDPYKAVLLQYTRYLRFTLLTRGLAPFELGGLQMVQQLITIEASLLRAQEKGGIRY
ncbi:transposase [Chloroflexi bacterium TSY]|nr:transposase [Chloroflexi bacterium TSY]